MARAPQGSNAATDDRQAPFRIAGLHLAGGLLWIWFWYVVRQNVQADVVDVPVVEALSGTLFVLMSAGLVLWLVRRESQRMIENARMLRAVVDCTTDAVFVKDRNGKYQLFNEAAARFVGKSITEVVGKDDREVFEAASAWDVMARDRQVMQGGVPETREEELTADGKRRTYLAMKAPFRDEFGQVAGLVGVSRDVTAWKDAERQLRAERDRFEKLVEAVPAFIHSFVLKPNGSTRFLYTGPRIEDLYAVGPDELAADAAPVFDRIHPDDFGRVMADMAESARSLGVWRSEYRIVHPSRGELWVEGHSAPVRQPDGSTIWHGYVVDITDRKRTEQQLSQSEERFRTLVEHATDAIFLHDAQGIVLDVNRCGCESMGYTHDELVGMSPIDFDPGVSQERLETILARLNEGEVVALDSHHLRKDGTVFPVEVRIRPFYADGQRYGIAMVRDITERKRAELDVRRSEEMLRLVLDNIPQGVFWKDQESRYLGCNRVVARALGFEDPARVVGRHIWDFTSVTPSQAAHFVEKDRRVMQSDTAVLGIIEPMTLADGRTIWLETNKVPMHDADGQVIGVLGTWQDITVRRQTENALQESEERLRQAVRASKLGLWDWDLTNNQVMFSPEWKAQLGCDEDEIGNDFSEWRTRVHPDDLQPCLDRVQTALAVTSRGYEAEFRMRHKDGGWRWIFATADVFRDEAGNPVRMLGGHIDVTARKQAEQALRLSEERFRRVFEHAATGIGIADMDGRLVDANPAYLAFLGYSAGEVCGRAIVEYIHPDDRDKNVLAMRRVATGETNTLEMENRFLHKQGHPVWAHKVISALPDLAGRPSHVLALVTDTTERRRAAEFLSRQNDVLEQVAAGRPLLDILDTIVRMVEGQCHGVIGSILLLESGTLRLGAAPNLPPSYNAAIDGVVIGPQVGSCGTAAYTRNTVDVADIATHPLWAAFRELALSHGLRACWSTPVFAAPRGEHRPAVLGTFAVYNHATAQFDMRLPEIVDRAGHLARIAIESARAERTLRESETRFRNLIEFLPDAIFLSIGGRVAFCNPACVRLFGATTPNDLLGKAPLELHPAEYHPAIRAKNDSQSPDRVADRELDEEIVRLDGTRVPVFVTSLSVTDLGDDAQLVVLHDLTERRRIEMQLRYQEMLLKEAAELSHVGGWGFDPVTLESDWTEEVARIHDLPDHTSPGVANGIDYYLEEDRPRIAEAVRQAIEHGTPYDLELQIQSAAGVRKWVRTICRPMLDSGTVVRVRGSLQDISDRKEAEAAILQLNAELEQRVQSRTAELEASNQELEAFSYSVSHDLRAPLRAIDGFSRIVQMEYAAQLPPEGQEYLGDIRSGVQRMGQLVDDLLRLSRLGRQAMTFRPIDTATLVNECVREVTRSVAPGQVEIRVGVLPECIGDVGLLRQVWLNLLSNAVKYSTGRTPAVVVVDSINGPEGPEYFVRDNGVGFDMKYAHKLFGVFQRLHKAEEYEGTGIGLALVQRIVRRHGGRVWAESEPGSGAVFHFTLGGEAHAD